MGFEYRPNEFFAVCLCVSESDKELSGKHSGTLIRKERENDLQ
jgi:hypothetical protein